MTRTLLGPAKRFELGIVVTLVRGKELRSEHLIGDRREVLLDLAARCDREGWRVRCISTPETILRDFGGARHFKRGARRKAAGAVAMPESTILGAIGRADLFVGRSS